MPGVCPGRSQKRLTIGSTPSRSPRKHIHLAEPIARVSHPGYFQTNTQERKPNLRVSWLVVGTAA